MRMRGARSRGIADVQSGGARLRNGGARRLMRATGRVPPGISSSTAASNPLCTHAHTCFLFSSGTRPPATGARRSRWTRQQETRTNHQEAPPLRQAEAHKFESSSGSHPAAMARRPLHFNSRSCKDLERISNAASCPPGAASTPCPRAADVLWTINDCDGRSDPRSAARCTALRALRWASPAASSLAATLPHCGR